MRSESFGEMHAATRTDYLGAQIRDEGRAILVALDPDDPWAAFKQMRRTMRARRSGPLTSVGIFSADAPLGHRADVIEMATRRRAS